MKNTILIPEQRTPHFYLPSHQVTWQYDLSCLRRNLSEGEVAQFVALCELAEKEAKAGEKEVRAFYHLHPNQSEILNLLALLAFRRKAIREGNRWVEENFRKNPDSLVARINYGDLCLRKNRVKQLPELFCYQWSPREFCPEKELFHISEFLGFMTLMGHYHLQVDQEEKAECYYYLAHQVAPEHPSTQVLRRRLCSPPLSKRVRDYLKKSLRSRP